MGRPDRRRAGLAALLVLVATATAEAHPPPPGPDTAGGAADWAGVAEAFGPDRLAQANRDRVLDPFLAFGAILGDDFTADTLVATARVLGAVQAAAGHAVAVAKGVYPRLRPYAVDPGLLRCGGAMFLAAGRSYPSGHAAIGAAWGVALAALLPERGDEIGVRAADYGASRIVCGFHWPSDVAAGQAVGAAEAAALLADPAFGRLLAAARAELAPFAD